MTEQSPRYHTKTAITITNTITINPEPSPAGESQEMVNTSATPALSQPSPSPPRPSSSALLIHPRMNKLKLRHTGKHDPSPDQSADRCVFGAPSPVAHEDPLIPRPGPLRVAGEGSWGAEGSRGDAGEALPTVDIARIKRPPLHVAVGSAEIPLGNCVLDRLIERR